MPYPSREQVLAIMFAFMMITSMMPSGAVASGGTSVEELDGGDEQLDAQFDVEGSESTTNTTDVNVSTLGPNGTVPDSYRATLQGEVENIGSNKNVTVYFEYREVGEDTFRQTPNQTLQSNTTFSELATYLQPDATHEFRAVAETPNGSDTGDLVEFTTERDLGIQFIEIQSGLSVWPPFVDATRTNSPATNGTQL